MAESTLSQRAYLVDLYDRLHWDKTGIRDMSKEEASIAIRKAKAAIATGQADEKDEESFI